MGSKRSWLRLQSVLALLMLVLAGCQEQGCNRSKGETPAEEQVDAERSEAPAEREAALVARFQSFSQTHGDLRHWVEKALEAGAIDPQRDDVRGGGLPSARLRLMVEDAFAEQAGAVRWDGVLDLVYWPSTPDQDASWAAVMQSSAGSQIFADAGLEPVETDDDAAKVWKAAGDAPLFVSGGNLAPTRRGQPSEALVLSNSAMGAARAIDVVAESALDLTMEYEIALRPSVLGLHERYAESARVMERQIGLSAHDLPPARVSLLRFQAQAYRAMGQKEAWPEEIRLTHTPERRDGKFKRGEFVVAMQAPPNSMLEQLWRTMRESYLEEGPRVLGATAEVGLVGRPNELAVLADALLPGAWMELLMGSPLTVQREMRAMAVQVLSHNRGPTTVAFYESDVALSPEIFVGWEILDSERLERFIGPMHTYLVQEFWQPLHGQSGAPLSETESLVLAGQTKEATHTFFLLEDGTRLGSCRAEVNGEHLSYFGVEACRRLGSIYDGRPRGSAPALSYQGAVSALIGALYELPQEPIDAKLDGVEISFGVARGPERTLTASWWATDPVVLGTLSAQLPKLSEFWEAEGSIDLARVLEASSTYQASYQDPSVMMIGPPGLMGVLPPAYLLGMPFSATAVPPSTLRELYLGEDNEESGSSTAD